MADARGGAGDRVRPGAADRQTGKQSLNAPVNWQQRAQHVDVQLNAQLG